MNPFLYSREKHIRSQNPKSQSRYQQYKSYLREEFQRKCVYCKMPDVWAQENFGVDHYRPKKQFPQLVTSYSNLYYCCNPCNSRKGSYWPTGAKARDRVIPNPCDHRMAAYLRYKRALVEAKTKCGAFTTELLDLNAPDAIQKRTLMLELIESCQKNRSQALQFKKAIYSKMTKGKMLKAVADAQLANLNSHIEKMDNIINKLVAGK